MKIYIGNKKQNGKHVYGLTIYSDMGKIIYCSKSYVDIDDNNFSNILKNIKWGIKKINTLGQNKVIDDTEKVLLMVSSKTIYKWFETKKAPEPYTVLMNDLLFEASFILNEIEIIYNKDSGKRVVYKNSTEDKKVKVTDLFK